MDYPANTQNPKIKVKVEDEKKVEKVIEGEIIVRKKPLGRRFLDTFGGSDAKSVWEFVLLDVLVPAAKDAIADATSQGVERMIFGEARSSNRRSSRYGSSSHTSYQRYSAPTGSRPTVREEPRVSRQNRAKHNFDDIILATRMEAEEVIKRLDQLVDRYGSASVSDLYDLVGVSSEFTDGKWGWVDLRGADINRIRQGYLLDLPRPEPLN
jgi:hypothetical protein